MNTSDFKRLAIGWHLDFDQIVEQTFARLIHEPWRGATSFPAPTLDIFETNDAYQLAMELPGVVPDAVELHADGQRLSISGNREAVRIDESRRALSLERSWGHFSRTVEFEQPVDFQGMEHHLTHGVLQIRVPKRSASTGKLTS